MALYWADAVLLIGKGERFEGPSAIIDYLRTIHGQANDLKLTVDKFGSCWDLGYDSGSFQNSVTSGGTVISGRTAISGNVSIERRCWLLSAKKTTRHSWCYLPSRDVFAIR